MSQNCYCSGMYDGRINYIESHKITVLVSKKRTYNKVLDKQQDSIHLQNQYPWKQSSHQ
jgi:hypothetical protein